jgi:hypothetical protein
MPTIQGGEWPFLVDALNARVAIQGLHFIRPRAGAVWVYASGGFTFVGCKVENIDPSTVFGMQASQPSAVSSAIFVGADPHPPSATQLGKPENFSGTMAILNNDMDVGATVGTQTLGVSMFNVGKSPDNEVDIYVSGNNIRNLTEPGINFRVIGGRASAERNVLVMGSVTAGGGPNLNATTSSDAIRIVGTGSYLVAHNSIDCGWVDGVATAISVLGQGNFPQASAVIVDNDVTMSAPDGTAFGALSGGIVIKGVATGNSVVNNTIRGRARAAMAVLDQNGNMPANTSLVANDVDGFQSSVAAISLDSGVTNTLVIGRQPR